MRAAKTAAGVIDARTAFGLPCQDHRMALYAPLWAFCAIGAAQIPMRRLEVTAMPGPCGPDPSGTATAGYRNRHGGLEQRRVREGLATLDEAVVAVGRSLDLESAGLAVRRFDDFASIDVFEQVARGVDCVRRSVSDVRVAVTVLGCSRPRAGIMRRHGRRRIFPPAWPCAWSV